MEINSENYFFTTDEITSENKVFILIIYDICNNNMRVKLSKFLSGYGIRVQKSAFEAVITKKKYRELQSKISQFIKDEDDSIKIYQLKGSGQVLSWGKKVEDVQEDIIVI